MQTLHDWDSVWFLDGQCARIRESFAANHVDMILIDGKCGGWVEVEETHNALHLHHLYLIRERRGLGIGSAIINRVLAVAHQMSKPVKLEVMKKNKDAYRLYKHLGFGTDGRDEQKVYMSRHSHVS